MRLWPRPGVPRAGHDRTRKLRAPGLRDLSIARTFLAADVIINEIMYNPSSFDDRDEWIELYNRDLVPVDLAGWRFTRGIDFTFPAYDAAGRRIPRRRRRRGRGLLRPIPA